MSKLYELKPNFSKVEVGKYYLTKLGDLVGPVGPSSKMGDAIQRLYPFMGRALGHDLLMCWTPDGLSARGSYGDLVWAIPSPVGHGQTYRPISYRRPMRGDKWLATCDDNPAMSLVLEWCGHTCITEAFQGHRVIVSPVDVADPIPNLATDTWDLI